MILRGRSGLGPRPLPDDVVQRVIGSSRNRTRARSHVSGSPKNETFLPSANERER